MYITVKYGRGKPDYEAHFIGTGVDSTIGTDLAIQAAIDFLERLESKLQKTPWSPAARKFAQEGGAFQVAIDTLRKSPVNEARDKGLLGVPADIYESGDLVAELAEEIPPVFGEGDREKMVRQIIKKLSEKGLLP